MTEGPFWPGLIFLFALLLRLIYFFDIKDTIWMGWLGMDATIYDNWARMIAIQGQLGVEIPFMNPGYALFLGFLYSLLRYNLSLVLLIQFTTGALSCVLVYFLGIKLFNRTAGVIAGLLASLYGISFLYEGTLLSASAINLLNLLLLLLLIEAREKTLRVLARRRLYSGPLCPVQAQYPAVPALCPAGYRSWLQGVG